MQKCAQYIGKKGCIICSTVFKHPLGNITIRSKHQTASVSRSLNGGVQCGVSEDRLEALRLDGCPLNGFLLVRVFLLLFYMVNQQRRFCTAKASRGTLSHKKTEYS